MDSSKIDHNLKLYGDEQKAMLLNTKRSNDDRTLRLLGQREDGELISATLTLEENITPQSAIEDFENFLSTFASSCSKKGVEEMDAVCASNK